MRESSIYSKYCPHCGRSSRTAYPRCPNCAHEYPAPGEMERALINQHMKRYLIAAWSCAVVSVCFLAGVIYRIYAYGASDKIVGGDAYNYNILATRGVGLICTGIALAIFACMFVLLVILEELKVRNNPG